MSSVKQPSDPIVGLNIGTSSIKAVEVRPTKQGHIISAVCVEPVPAGLVDETGTIPDTAALGRFVKDMLKRNGIVAKKCVASLPGQSGVTVRFVQMPKQTPAELNKSIKHEITRHIPFASSTDVTTDYIVVPDSLAATDDTLEVLLAAVPLEAAEAIGVTVQKSGLQPEAMEPEVMAMARLVPLDPTLSAENTSIAVLNIGTMQSEMGVYDAKGTIRMAWQIPIGGGQFTQALLDRLPGRLSGTEPEERKASAEELKRTKGEIVMELLNDTRTDSGMGAGMMDFSFAAGAEGMDLSSFGDSTAEPAFDDSLDFNSGLDFGGENPFAEGMPTVPVEPTYGAETASSDTLEDAPMDFGADTSSGLGEAPAVESAVPATQTDVRDELQREVFNAMADTLDSLIFEVKRALDMFNARDNEPHISKLVLCGGGAMLKNLDQALAQSLSLPTTVANPFLSDAGLVAKYGDYLNEVSPLLSVAVCLAMRDWVA